VNQLCGSVGVTKNETLTDYSKLELSIRQELEKTVSRVFALLEPLKIRITNLDSAKTTVFDVPNHPQYPDMGSRIFNLTPVIYIDQSDFREVNTEEYFRLAPGKTVRLLFSLNITCDEVVRDSSGGVTELLCSLNSDPTLKPKGKIQWLSETAFVKAEMRLYDHLLKVESLDDSDGDLFDCINPKSLVTRRGMVEKWMATMWDKPGTSYQFQRLGYFCIDKDSNRDRLVFNRTTSLRESSAAK